MEDLAHTNIHSNLTRICPICGNNFSCTNKNRIYCSSRCSKKAEKRRYKSRNIVGKRYLNHYCLKTDNTKYNNIVITRWRGQLPINNLQTIQIKKQLPIRVNENDSIIEDLLVC